jgi:beta-lactamase superfamily II metal-dependent hydrolase
MKIKFLEAFNGDSILLSFGDKEEKNRNILIDGGTGKTYFQKNKKGKIQYNDLFKVVNSIRAKNEKIDLLILTHVDDDHIGGILKWLENDPQAHNVIEKVWFNSGKIVKEYYESDQTASYDNSLDFNYDETTNTGIKQGVKFEDFISKKEGLWNKKIIKSGQKLNEFGLEFKILSPNEEKLKLLLHKWEKEEPESLETGIQENDYNFTLKEHIENDSFQEDNSIHNGSSIGFIITYQGKNLLFLGDSHPSVIIKSLHDLTYTKEKPIQCELVKISHHGSKSNNCKEMLDLIDSNKFVICTNGDKHAHPHKRFLARLINQKNTCEIYFNYPELIEQIFKKEDIINFPKVKALNFPENECYI